MATIVRASASDIDDVAVLFAVYRRFYDQPTDLAKAKAIIGDRIRNDESVIFLACTENDDAIDSRSFTQHFVLSLRGRFGFFTICSSRNKRDAGMLRPN